MTHPEKYHMRLAKKILYHFTYFFLFKMNLRLGEMFRLLNQKLNIYFIQTCIILIFLVVTRHSMLLLLQLFLVVGYLILS